MAMRDVTEAHFLHQRSGLEAVLRPPVSQPAALAWLKGREELIAAGRDGTLHAVDPVLGTRVVARDLGSPVVLALHPDRKRFLVVDRHGVWTVGKLTGSIDATGDLEWTGEISGFWLGEYAVLVGDSGKERVLVILGDGEIKARMVVPARSVPLAGEDGKLALAISTPAGLEIVKVARNTKYPEHEPTAHRLRACGKHVIGLTATGVAVWGREGGQPRSMRLPDLTAGDMDPAGEYLGLGTRTGAVALAALQKVDARAKPHLVKAFEEPVTSVAFSDRGQWLATGGEALQIWTWED